MPTELEVDHAIDPCLHCGCFVLGGPGGGIGGRRRRHSQSTSVPSTPGSQLRARQELIQARDFRNALPLLQQVVQKDPRNADAYNLMGYAVRSSGDPNGSLQYYQQALAIDPRHLGAHNTSARPT